MYIKWWLRQGWNSEDALATLIPGLVMLGLVTFVCNITILQKLTILCLLLIAAAAFSIRLHVLKRVSRHRVWDNPQTLRTIFLLLLYASVIFAGVLATTAWTSVLTLGWIPLTPIMFVGIRLHQLKIERDSDDMY